MLRKTQMPAVLVEAGFIDNPEDNAKFDAQFEEIAGAIATGILDVVKQQEENYYYMIRQEPTVSVLWLNSSLRN